MNGVTGVLAGLRAAQHLVTRLGDAGFPVLSATSSLVGIVVHLDGDMSPRIAADTLELDVTGVRDVVDTPGCPAYTVVYATVGGWPVSLFGAYDVRDPRPTPPLFDPVDVTGWDRYAEDLAAWQARQIGREAAEAVAAGDLAGIVEDMDAGETS